MELRNIKEIFEYYSSWRYFEEFKQYLKGGEKNPEAVINFINGKSDDWLITTPIT